MSFKVKGKIKAIGETMSFDSGAKKLSFQLDSGEQYNNIYSFDLFKNADNLQHLDKWLEFNKVGNSVEVEFNIDCREYQGKYYTNLSMWRCENAAKEEEPTAVQMGDDSEGDDLPF